MRFVPQKFERNVPSLIESRKYTWRKPILFSAFVSVICFLVLPDAAKKYAWLILFVLPIIFRMSYLLCRQSSTENKADDFIGWW